MRNLIGKKQTKHQIVSNDDMVVHDRCKEENQIQLRLYVVMALKGAKKMLNFL